MPPKKPTGAASKPAATKAPAKTAGAKPAAAKSGGASKQPAKTAKDVKAKEPAKPEEKKEIKKVLTPLEIGLKEIANVIYGQSKEGQELKESKRWLYIIDRNGNVGTFLKYRDMNMIFASNQVDFQPEPIRKSLMGALRFGKPHVIDITDTDQGGIMALLKDKYDEISPGLYGEIMDRSIIDTDNCGKLYNISDPDEYKNNFEYNTSGFQFIILTNIDPPSTVMEDFFPVIVS